MKKIFLGIALICSCLSLMSFVKYENWNCELVKYSKHQWIYVEGGVMGLGTMCGFDWRVSTMISEDGSYWREYLEHSAGWSWTQYAYRDIPYTEIKEILDAEATSIALKQRIASWSIVNTWATSTWVTIPDKKPTKRELIKLRLEKLKEARRLKKSPTK